mmetsp:Transcript_30055/g.55313  ORF Transcript_30055/g.55313 Transcript_30055/m.55313 type:complete len:173 (-) Transcript_30055:13-531(-)
MKSLSSCASSTTTTIAFHPLDRMSWLRNIAMVTGMTTCSGDSSADYACLYGMGARDDLSLYDVLGGSRFTADGERDLMCRSSISNSSSSTPVMTQGYDLFGYTVPPQMGMTYCSPVSSSESSIASLHTETNEQLYLDVLSMASGSSGNTGISPICAMLDDGHIGDTVNVNRR